MTYTRYMGNYFDVNLRVCLPVCLVILTVNTYNTTNAVGAANDNKGMARQFKANTDWCRGDGYIRATIAAAWRRVSTQNNMAYMY